MKKYPTDYSPINSHVKNNYELVQIINKLYTPEEVYRYINMFFVNHTFMFTVMSDHRLSDDEYYDQLDRISYELLGKNINTRKIPGFKRDKFPFENSYAKNDYSIFNYYHSIHTMFLFSDTFDNFNKNICQDILKIQDEDEAIVLYVKFRIIIDSMELYKTPHSQSQDGQSLKCTFCGITYDTSKNSLVNFSNGGTICENCFNAISSHYQITPSEEFDMHEQEKCFTDENILVSFSNKKNKKEKKKLPVLTLEVLNKKTPKYIHEKLSEFVIGQEKAKKTLSVSVYNHYKKILTANEDEDIEFDKNNIMMLGPSGSGKTYLVQNLAKILDVPLAMIDSTPLTQAGYIGEDVETAISKLLNAADGNIELAERGIIFIDEADKLAAHNASRAHARDVSGEGVQQALLKMVEGKIVSLPRDPSTAVGQNLTRDIDTTNILFIFAGAFVGLEKIINKRQSTASMGFFGDLKSDNAIEENLEQLMENVQPEDLIKFGIIPELVGRIPVRVSLNRLDVDALCKILTEPKNSLIKQYIHLFELDNVKLKFTTNAIKAIAQKAHDLKVGARGLKTIIDNITLDIMFEIPTRKIKEGEQSLTIDKKHVNGVPLSLDDIVIKKIKAKSDSKTKEQPKEKLKEEVV